MQTRSKRLANSEELRSLTVRMPAEVKEPLRETAKKLNVSIANLLTVIVAKDLGIEGYELPEPHKKY